MVALSPRKSVLERVAAWIGARRARTPAAARVRKPRTRTPLLVAFTLAVFDESISLAALAAFTYAGFQLAPWAGWIVLGVCLLVADTAVPAAVRKRRAEP